MEGYIKLYRKLLENPVICKDSDYLSVWVFLLLNATHKDYPALFKGEKITLKPGQLITGRKAISVKLNINESKVQRILKSFKIEHQIEQQASNVNRLITIINWNEYQQCEQQNEQPVNNQRTTSEQPVNTNKNDKNDKNDKKYNKAPIEIAIEDFEEMRKKIRKPLTPRAKELMLKKLKDLAKDEKTQIAILEQSVMNGWQGVFPLKEAQQKKSNVAEWKRNFWEEPGYDGPIGRDKK